MGYSEIIILSEIYVQAYLTFGKVLNICIEKAEKQIIYILTMKVCACVCVKSVDVNCCSNTH